MRVQQDGRAAGGTRHVGIHGGVATGDLEEPDVLDPGRPEQLDDRL